MTTKKEKEEGTKLLFYIIFGLLALYIVWLILKLTYYSLSYLSLNLFLGLDLSVFGQLSQDHWIGYSLLGLGFGAAAAAIAAQQRFRLNKLVLVGAVIVILGLSSFVFINNSATEEAQLSETEEITEEIEVTPSDLNVTEEVEKEEVKNVTKSAPEVRETKQVKQSKEEANTELIQNPSSPEPIQEEVTEEIPVDKQSTSYLLQLMESYYSSLNSENFNAENFFAPTVKRYIRERNLPSSKINNLHREYRYEFTNGSNTIDYTTFKHTESNKGINYYEYWTDFTCFRLSKQKNQSCRILVEVGIDEEGKMVSYKEAKVRDLRFF